MSSIYSGVVSGLLQRGEQLFPLCCFGDVAINWSCVLEWLDGQPWEGDEC